MQHRGQQQACFNTLQIGILCSGTTSHNEQQSTTAPHKVTQFNINSERRAPQSHPVPPLHFAALLRHRPSKMCANAATSAGRVPAAKPAKLPSSTVQPHNFNGCSQGCQFPALHPFDSLVLTHIQHQRHQLYAQHCFLGLVLVGFCITLVGHHFGQQASCFTPLTLHVHPTETCLFFFFSPVSF